MINYLLSNRRHISKLIMYTDPHYLILSIFFSLVLVCKLIPLEVVTKIFLLNWQLRIISPNTTLGFCCIPDICLTSIPILYHGNLNNRLYNSYHSPGYISFSSVFPSLLSFLLLAIMHPYLGTRYLLYWQRSSRISLSFLIIFHTGSGGRTSRLV